MIALCVATHCRTRGQHAPNCPGGDCVGCQPRRAADGLALCLQHTDLIAADAHTAARLYDALAAKLTTAGIPGERTSGSRNPGLSLDDRAVQTRTLIRHRLVSWALLIAEERGFGLPDDTMPALAAYIASSALWLAAHPAAADASAELAELVALAHPIAYPSGTRVVQVGPCPHAGCAGTIRALLRRVDSLLPSSIVCDADDQHAWPASEWLTLGREIRRVAA